MRQKITDAEQLEEELPKLTPKQLRYVQARMAGDNQSDAYRKAYDTEGWQDSSVWVNACQLEKHHKVATWMTALRAAGALDASCSKDQHLAELERLKQIALRSGNVGAAVQAEQLRGKASGHYVDKIEDITPNTDDLEHRLQRLKETRPDLAHELAVKAGISLTEH